MDLENLLLEKMKADEISFKEFLDKSGILYRTLLMFIERYFDSFVINGEFLDDDKTKISYEFKKLCRSLSLIPTFESSFKIRSGVCSFNFGPSDMDRSRISITVIEDNVLIKERFETYIKDELMCARVETIIYSKSQCAKMRENIETNNVRTYEAASNGVGAEIIHVVGEYITTDSGMVKAYTIADNSFGDKRKIMSNSPGLYLMDPYNYQNRYIEDQGYFERIRDEEEAIR